MSEVWNLFLSTLSQFIGDGRFVIYAAVCLIVMMFEKEKRHQYAWPIVILVVIIFNPIVIVYMNQSVLQGGRISKLYMILPIFMVIAYAAAKYCKRWYAVLVVALLIIITGQFMITREVYDRPANPYKLDAKVIEVCDFMEQDIGNTKEEAVVLAEPELVNQIRQYNPQFILTLNRYSYWQSSEYTDLLREQMVNGEIEAESFCKCARQNGIEYIVIFQYRLVNGDMSEYGYNRIGDVSEYSIYKYVE